MTSATSNGVSSSLHAHRFLLRAGLSLANVFAWIFVFEYFYLLSGNVPRSLATMALLFGFAQFITIVFTPVAAAHLQRGARRSLIWGVVCAGSAFVLLGGTLSGYFSAPLLWGIVGFATLAGMYRALYFVPYRVTQTALRPHEHMRAYLEVIIALMPLFAGLTISSIAFAQGRLLFGASALIILSALPVFWVPDTRERFSWSYVYTFKQLWRRKNYGLVLQSLFEGLQGAALFLVWPLAVFLILEWSYFMLGLVLSVTLLLILLLRRLYAWLLQRFGLENSAAVYTVLAISGWIGRLAAGTPVGVIIADSYAYTTTPERGTRFDPFSFEQVSDRGAFVDEYTALKEIALALGRIMLCAIVFVLVFAFALPVVFAIVLGIAAAASGLAILVARRGAAPAY
ncbi:hypothetical protein A3A39_02750 [Candidatus Kaiserbacteria bacterium RIFCSPLOWO2_01_FULL_54_13]|uniref:Major facilitator superfamily (MFS) profile domain-containing protein n=1 Tax=Candidatus Kaiserbacteria bacterium RIFCSPLOWO2_01_FULL_54_13 TaxID=1798512 RepID=A0A1F6F2I7_9BACT|nr:MAG: hypothetical protein A3A39_02750 [Candidatus Kaiserbacteria bacterium RIFCSPLOWO2_01_FULL_54_13]